MGYSVNHVHDVYRMLNMETKYVINSRDIIWLNQMYNNWKIKKVKKYIEDDAIEPKINVINKVQEEVQVEKVLDEQKRVKVYRNLRQLESSVNSEASRTVERIKQGRKILLNHANLAFLGGVVVEQKEPTTFDEAWNHNDPRTQEKWQEAINKEFEEMKKKEVWEVMKKEDIPQDRRTIKCKWIFKIERNGVFRARLVACGYSQIPGIDFNENFAPVVNNVTFRIMLIAKLIWNLQASIVDIETALLHGDLQEEIYMNVPEDLQQDSNSCLLLKKTIYGLVQSAREFYNKLLSTLKSMGFTENKSDPCLLSK
jgi:Reverse transcriptase (RNA-dependent DNA polymerase)